MARAPRRPVASDTIMADTDTTPTTEAPASTDTATAPANAPVAADTASAVTSYTPGKPGEVQPVYLPDGNDKLLAVAIVTN